MHLVIHPWRGHDGICINENPVALCVVIEYLHSEAPILSCYPHRVYPCVQSSVAFPVHFYLFRLELENLRDVLVSSRHNILYC